MAWGCSLRYDGSLVIPAGGCMCWLCHRGGSSTGHPRVGGTTGIFPSDWRRSFQGTIASGNTLISPLTAKFQPKRGYGDVELRMFSLSWSWAVTFTNYIAPPWIRKLSSWVRFFCVKQSLCCIKSSENVRRYCTMWFGTQKVLNKLHDEKTLQET